MINFRLMLFSVILAISITIGHRAYVMGKDLSNILKSTKIEIEAMQSQE